MIRPLIATATLAVAAVLASVAAHAQSGHQQQAPAAASSASAADYAEGEVRKVDKDARKITLRHGPIPSLGMGNMTMVFGVKDPALLERVKAGDKVRFKAEQAGGQLFVTEFAAPK